MKTSTENLKQAGFTEDDNEIKQHKKQAWYLEEQEYKKYELWISSQAPNTYISIEQTTNKNYRLQFVYKKQLAYREYFKTYEEYITHLRKIFGIK